VTAYMRTVAKTISLLAELQEGYDEGTQEWAAYDDMLEAIMAVWGQIATRETDQGLIIE
jgi:hypothetical protein